MFRHDRSVADLSSTSAVEYKDLLECNAGFSHSNSLAAIHSVEKAIPLDLSAMTDSTILSKKTSRVDIDGIVGK